VGDKLRPAESDVKQMTTRCCGRVLQQHNIKRKYSLNQMFSRCAENGVSAGSPRLFLGLLAGYPQCFAQGFKGKSAENQRDFHMFCTRFPCNFTQPFFRSFFDGIPKEIADSAGKKKGVNGAECALLRKKVGFSVRATFPTSFADPNGDSAQRM
jgi:hypothetical protein